MSSRRRLRRAGLLAAPTVATTVAGQRAEGMFGGERQQWTRHADAVADWALSERGSGVNSTGSQRFDGEWARPSRPTP